MPVKIIFFKVTYTFKSLLKAEIRTLKQGVSILGFRGGGVINTPYDRLAYFIGVGYNITPSPARKLNFTMEIKWSINLHPCKYISWEEIVLAS